ncbi:hypothetical protein [Mesorhizobium carmichaelinearum]|uniref:hypothetical protein n=1 Tax=Mesorhizobium carmichaelinearum TaxID=1208188 RepID=UPI0015CE1748|nr:hypothetical protein [Mesorhizobium carmichaelinearum]
MSVGRASNSTIGFRYDEDVRFLTMVADLVGRTIGLHRTLWPLLQRHFDEQSKSEKSLDQGTTGRALHPRAKTDGIIGESPALKQVLETVSVVAGTNTNGHVD